MATNPFDQYVDKLHQYAAQGDTKMVSACVKGMPDVNVKNDQGWTALMFAARNNHPSVVKILMDSGCDTSAINSSGQMALDIGKFWNHHEVVKLLSPQPNSGSASLAAQPRGQNTTINFFAGSVLDRADFHRKDKEWLANIKKVWKTKYVLFKDLAPVVVSKPDHTLDTKQGLRYRLYTATYEDIKEYLSLDPVLVFLGMERKVRDTGESVTRALTAFSKTDGDADIAWFAVDATKFLEHESKLGELHAHAELLSVYPGLMQIEQREAAILGHARSMLAWHDRYKYCATCGSATKVEDSGYKRTCNNKECRSHKGIHNTTYPRVDCSVIMAIVYPDHKRLLLGRSKKFPRGLWSCLAGYAEPGESIEDTVRREVFEEVGIHVGRVEYHSSQPWPMPSSLMIGCLAYATTTDIKLDKNELDQAAWFTREEVLLLLTRRHPQRLFCPPEQAIAHHLIRAWVNRTSNL